ncbi:1-deoxy-D-xylulose-5-phosphate reductoisomerase [Acetivibrio saccincola]|jgi:1-deoxy-D-xylulose-5-phosphate reductoisomerase|uniref:1-deoxy-D-xylulose 5-phosphate reductoisomerase n=1 Tax=Acetivibrio saccincola TaxID=1677857 RepID=A0A2S8RBM7_9FIRM|nr:1-deoxy-D-xylulose-5-phosphate reductoisomerase [Acetivibrio saccincola]NLW26823.1 1-deoxy-D-xylulose-5-phosphate reductoisomerase [Acetivibrio saccincola]PQQ67198.1 1-deoxy-D-xylulose-5-phosphate reductoisomerase [Acetivibrio saccincola]HQD27856.1 1-deoxy-D-xylulose-5-phosphate reductoisomerase [Acetivibrio saccincola]
MVKSISILGSTGSIGVQTLDVARNLNIKVEALSGNTNIDLLEAQAREFKPSMVAVRDVDAANVLKERLSDLGIEVAGGMEGLKRAASLECVDMVVVSIVGIAGLIPTMEAIENKKNIALANKETLVTAGSIVMKKAEEKGVKILPIDSEHSAVFQCLMGNNIEDVSKIILTASGGPFRNKTKEELEKVTVKEALKHPNWDMGSKITIDSATLMNKGLEVIEAKWLFGLPVDKIEVLVHPQSIIHSMVEYNDGSVMAQLGLPDMRLPIQFALRYPKRSVNGFPKLDFLKHNNLTFEMPDTEKFPCLRLSYEAIKAGGTMPAVMNAANEEVVSLFIGERINFIQIPQIIEKVMEKHQVKHNPSLEDIIEVDLWAREVVKKII